VTIVGRIVARALALATTMLAIASPAEGQTEDGGVRAVSVDSSHYPSIEAVVAIPRVMTQGLLRARQVEVVEGLTPHPVELEVLDPADVDLAVVVDGSLTRDDLGVAQGGLVELGVHLPEPDLALVAAEATARVVLPLTGDRHAVGAGLRQLAGGGESDIRAGVDAALELFPSDATRPVMVVVAGEMGPEDAGWDAIRARALTAGVIIYVISFGFPVDPGLARLVYASGGLSATSPATFVGAVDRMIADIRDQYRVRVRLTGDVSPAAVMMTVTARGESASVRLPIDTSVIASRSVATAPWRSDRRLLILVLAAAVLLAAIVSGLIFGDSRRAGGRPPRPAPRPPGWE
jgi:hypothetical protein